MTVATTVESAQPARISTAKRRPVPTILQIEAVECGAASLGMVLASMGRWVSLRELRAACHIGRDGSTATGIMSASETFGLVPDGRMASLQELQGAAMPAVVWWNHRHFVVLEGAKDGKFYVNDPALGPQKYSQEYFGRYYSHSLLARTSIQVARSTGSFPTCLCVSRAHDPESSSLLLPDFLPCFPGCLLRRRVQHSSIRCLNRAIETFWRF